MNKSIALMGILIFILTLLVAFQPAISIAQSSLKNSAPATQWQKLYGSGSSESVSNLIQTSDGGYAFLDLRQVLPTTRFYSCNSLQA